MTDPDRPFVLAASLALSGGRKFRAASTVHVLSRLQNGPTGRQSFWKDSEIKAPCRTYHVVACQDDAGDGTDSHLPNQRVIAFAFGQDAQRQAGMRIAAGSDQPADRSDGPCLTRRGQRDLEFISISNSSQRAVMQGSMNMHKLCLLTPAGSRATGEPYARRRLTLRAETAPR